MVTRARRHRLAEVAPDARELFFGPLRIDLARREIRVRGHRVPSTRLEFDLFARICRTPAEVTPRADLIEAVWGPNWYGDPHVVDVHLSNLRRKLAQRASDVQFMHTVRGVGFRLSDELVGQIEIGERLLAARGA
jgi:two-component system OmpR family response regulator